jgi:hypothetical protein
MKKLFLIFAAIMLCAAFAVQAEVHPESRPVEFLGQLYVGPATTDAYVNTSTHAYLTFTKRSGQTKPFIEVFDTNGTTSLYKVDSTGAVTLGAGLALSCTGCVDATAIATDAVDSAEIKANAVGNSEMADNAVGSTEVTNDSLTADDLAANSVGASELDEAGDYTVKSLTATNQITGLARFKYAALGTMTNGSTETTSYMDDTPTGEWTEVDAGAEVTVSEDAAIYMKGAKSLHVQFTGAAVVGDGVSNTIAGDNLEANESIGFWIYSTVALIAGDLKLQLTDDGGARDFNIPAVPVAAQWTWVEVDISSLAAGTGDNVTAVKVLLNSDQPAFDLYLDGMWKWDATDEEALGVAVLDYPGNGQASTGAVLVTGVVTAAGSPNTQTVLAEDTDYFIHRESGVDFIVTATDQSTVSGLATVFY